MFQKLMNQSRDDQLMERLYSLLPEIITSQSVLDAVNSFLLKLGQTETYSTKSIRKEDPSPETAQALIETVTQIAINTPAVEYLCYNFLMFLATGTIAYTRMNTFSLDESYQAKKSPITKKYEIETKWLPITINYLITSSGTMEKDDNITLALMQGKETLRKEKYNGQVDDVFSVELPAHTAGEITLIVEVSNGWETWPQEYYRLELLVLQ